MTDYRAARMPSAEGKGVAREAWDAYVKVVTKGISPVAKPYVVGKVEGLVGFWVMWHAYGGYERLIELGYSPSSVHRRVKAFRQTFGEHPDTFKFHGLTLDQETFLARDEPTGD